MTSLARRCTIWYEKRMTCHIHVPIFKYIVMKEKTMHNLRCIRYLLYKFNVEIFFINLLLHATNYRENRNFVSEGERKFLIVLNWHNIFHIYTVKCIALEVLTLDIEGEICITQLAGIGWAQSNQQLKYANIQPNVSG